MKKKSKYSINKVAANFQNLVSTLRIHGHWSKKDTRYCSW